MKREFRFFNNNKYKWAIVLVIIAIAITIILFFVFNPKQPGVELSCIGNQIIGYGYVVTTLSIIPPATICQVNLNVNYGDTQICSVNTSIVGTPEVISCPGLENYVGDRLKITADFYNTAGASIGTTSGSYLYNQS